MRAIKLVLPDKVARQTAIRGWNQATLHNAAALVLGAGAIGNETLKNLALLGFGYVLICDMDAIEETNLSRTVLFREGDIGRRKAEIAAARYLELNVDDGGRADAFAGNILTELGTGAFNHVDVVIGCLDNLLTRYEANRRCSLVGKPYIDAGIADLTGNVTAVNGGPDAPCWACLYGADLATRTQRMVRQSCAVIGAQQRAMGHVPTTQVASALVSALQTQEVVKCLHAANGGSMPFAPGKAYLFNGWYNSFDTVSLERRPDCEDHRRLTDIRETPLSCQSTLRQALEYVRDRFGADYVLTTEPDSRYRLSSFLTTARCRHCGRRIVLNRFAGAVTEADLYCPDCPREPNGLSEEWEGEMYSFALCPEHEPFMGLTLRELGVPPLHILEFFDARGEKPDLALELTGDLPALMPNLPRVRGKEAQDG